jgi:hypothetical protein
LTAEYAYKGDGWVVLRGDDLRLKKQVRVHEANFLAAVSCLWAYEYKEKVFGFNENDPAPVGDGHIYLRDSLFVQFIL